MTQKATVISPSILAADAMRLGEEVRSVLDGGAEYIHVDVMDGVFVPNLSFGVPVVRNMRRMFPDAFLDVHLMITKPGRYIGTFSAAGASLITVHVEAEEPEFVGETIAEIRSHGLKAGLAIRPKTPLDELEPWLPDLSMVLVMTVEPGFGAQPFMTDQLPRIREVRAQLDRVNPGCDIEVDGGITDQTAPLVREAGANVLVAGSFIYGKPDRARAIAALRGNI